MELPTAERLKALLAHSVISEPGKHEYRLVRRLSDGELTRLAEALALELALIPPLAIPTVGTFFTTRAGPITISHFKTHGEGSQTDLA